jgi:adsorption protein B
MFNGSIPSLAVGLHWLQLAERELLLFAAFWFIVSAIDEFAIDICWLWLRLTGRSSSLRLNADFANQPLAGRTAVLVPAWQEAGVIGAMISHTLKVWPQRDLRLYVGCYCNDVATLEAAMAGAGHDPRVRLVIHGQEGPTTKADCLNRLYAAISADEARSGVPFCSVVMHDAEDMVHPAGLALIDRALAVVDFVQLPVRPEPQHASRWVAGHYSDEFTEAHAKAMVVRDALGAAIPAAGVGCGFSRAALFNLARVRMAENEGGAAVSAGPFAAECLTEDYELGLLISRQGGRGRFLRVRDEHGALVATRSFFPARLDEAVRQKTRWVHGIALQGWDRLGWVGKPVEIWMAVRDRRGLLTSLVLMTAYLLLVVECALMLADWAGVLAPMPRSAELSVMLIVSFASLMWRALMRFIFTTREYGLAEGALSVLRIPVANIIAIMAGRRALFAYMRSLKGERVVWDKTTHHAHPAFEGVLSVPSVSSGPFAPSGSLVAVSQ